MAISKSPQSAEAKNKRWELYDGAQAKGTIWRRTRDRTYILDA